MLHKAPFIIAPKTFKMIQELQQMPELQSFYLAGGTALEPPIEKENIRMLSLQDISAMKLNAIINSGKRLKDYIDIYYLLEHFCFDDMVEFSRLKYPHMSPMIAFKAVTYFDDIDPEMDPPNLKNPLPLDDIKQRINQAVLHGHKIFKPKQ